MNLRHASLLVLCVGMLSAAGCRGIHKHISDDETPYQVREGFQREFPGLTISHVDAVMKAGGQIEYQVKFRDARHEYHRRMFGTDGKLLDTREGVALPAGGGPVQVPGTMPGASVR